MVKIITVMVIKVDRHTMVTAVILAMVVVLTRGSCGGDERVGDR